MKKLTVILMILFVGILLAGCTSQTTTPAETTAPTAVATEAPTAVPTAEPTKVTEPDIITTEVPTEVPTTEATPIPDAKIKIANTLNFEPSVLNIPAGTKVIFSTDAIGYKFKVALSGPGFNAVSNIITPDASWSYTFTKPGTYTMDEQIYPQFRDSDAKIVVT